MLLCSQCVFMPIACVVQHVMMENKCSSEPIDMQIMVWCRQHVNGDTYTCLHPSIGYSKTTTLIEACVTHVNGIRMALRYICWGTALYGAYDGLLAHYSWSHCSLVCLFLSYINIKLTYWFVRPGCVFTIMICCTKTSNFVLHFIRCIIWW